ncbi:Aladin [Glycine max]|nr:Aladin [Glycine max]
MASFPPPGSLTLCEVNRDLITVDALSDDRANQTYGKILGLVFSPVPFHNLENDASDQEGPTATETAAGESVQRKCPVALLQGLVNNYLGRLFYPNDVHLLPEVDLQGVSWHPNKHIIAFISAPTQVLVRDYQESEGKDPSILTNESQRDARVLEWRPNGGKMLAVGCKGGICMWAASYPGNAASVRSGAASFLGGLSRSSGNRYILVDFLRSPYDEHVSALSWSPDGRYPYLCQKVLLIFGFCYVFPKYDMVVLLLSFVIEAAV